MITAPEAPLPAPESLLVRLPNPLGDAVLATPALRGLRQALAGTRIIWAGPPAPLRALEGLPYADGVMPVAGPMRRGWRAPLRAGRMWRRVGCDAVLLLTHSLRSALAARVSGARTRVGSGREGTGLLLTRTVRLPEDGPRLAPRSMVRMYLDLAAPFGVRPDGRGPVVTTTAFDRRVASRRLAGHTEGGAYFVVNPGAAFGPTKIYPPARMGGAARRVRDRTGLTPLVVCGPGEEGLARRAAEATGEPCLTTHRRPPDVRELKALIAGAALCLTTDAGPRHLAEALGIPTVVVMGPTDPRWTEGSLATVVRKEGLDCLGCHRRACPVGHPCMETLEPEDVAEACLRALAQRGLDRAEGTRSSPIGG